MHPPPIPPSCKAAAGAWEAGESGRRRGDIGGEGGIGEGGWGVESSEGRSEGGGGKSISWRAEEALRCPVRGLLGGRP